MPDRRPRAKYGALLAVWLINAGAFWLAEVLTAPTPTTAEPFGVLLIALAGTLGLAVVAAAFAAGVARALGRPLPHLWLAFVPGLLLCAPRLAFTLRAMPSEAAPLVAGAAATALVLAAVWRRDRDERRNAYYVAYAAGALAVWTLLHCTKNVASTVPLAAEPIATNLLVVRWTAVALAPLAIAIALAARRHGALTGWLAAAGVALVAARFVAPALATPPAAATTPAARGGAPAMPIVLIVMDTTRVDHLSVYGYGRDTTPELSKLARDAVVFDNAVSTSSWTLPAHASLFTGLFPLRHGADRPYWLARGDEADPAALRPGLPLTDDHTTMAEWLRAHGYQTGAVASNFGYLDPAFGLGQGFEFYDAAPNTPVKPFFLTTVHRRIAPLTFAARHWRMYRTAEQVNRAAVRWLRARRSDAIFLFLNYMEPHREWTAPGLRHDAYAAEPVAPRARLRPDALAEDLRPVVDLYDSQVAALDAAIGAVLDELRRLGLYDRALVVVTSDHGESFGEHGVVGHGQSVFEPEVAIPLLIKYPRSRDAGRRPERVQLVDILPTIAAELGLPAPDGIEGDPVSGVRHPILAEFYTDPRAPEGVVRGYQAALYEGPLKLMAGDHLSGVFDVHDDPAERRSLATHALAQRRAWVDERRRTLEASLRARSQPVAPLDPGVERALRALGYVDDGEPAHP